MTMIFWRVGTGATAIVSRAVGARNVQEARRTTNQALTLAVFLGTVGTAAILTLAPLLAQLLNMSGTAADVATRYMRIESLGFLGAAVSFALASCLRGAGDTRTPMVILGGVNVVNVLATWLMARGL